MAASWTFSANDLRCLKYLIEREAAWRILGKGRRYREYWACCTGSQYFNVEPKGSGPGYICCQLVVFKRDDGYVFSLMTNGRSLGSFSGGALHRKRYVVAGLGSYYILTFESVLVPMELGFLPQFTVPVSVAGCCAVTPAFLYDHCIMVTEEEAASVATRGTGTDRAVSLGGAGAWCSRNGRELCIYAYVLKFDLFTGCCARDIFPSMAKLLSEMVTCADQTCVFCTDHGKHTDPSGRYVGCTPDRGTCFCYAPCATEEIKISNPDNAVFFTDGDGPATVNVSADSGGRLSVSPGDYVKVADIGGVTLPFKGDAWVLVKFEPALSRLIVLSCPVLKRLVLNPH